MFWDVFNTKYTKKKRGAKTPSTPEIIVASELSNLQIKVGKDENQTITEISATRNSIEIYSNKP